MNNFNKITWLVACCLCICMGPVFADTRNAEYKSVDAKLNETYRKIKNLIRKDNLPALREAQRAWIKMRDLDCKWASVNPLDCLIERTWNRETELRHSNFFSKDGRYMNLE